MERTQLIRICQIYPSTIPPIRFGIKNTVRKMFVPFSSRVSKSARPSAITLITTIETTAYETVKPKAEIKILMSQIRDRKTHRYYKCKSCKTVMRVPKGRGKIEITCPKCRMKVIKKT